ncbi:MAG: hypothetical protein Q9201_006387 [Fulgogasparrea decipioides]
MQVCCLFRQAINGTHISDETQNISTSAIRTDSLPQFSWYISLVVNVFVRTVSRMDVVNLLKPIWLLVFSLFFYVGILVVYRLFLSPLAKVPGPKLAALTHFYEIYFDLVQKARFPWKIEELHKSYGPIVRIRPDEVHINDLAYTEIHFSTSTTIDHHKYKPHQNQFGMPQSTFNTIESGLHRVRRNAIAPFFSKRNVFNLEPMVRAKVEKVCSRLEEYRRSNSVMDLRLLFGCMTTDIITEYAFPHCFDLLDTPDLSPAWRKTFATGLRNFQWFKHFPSLWNVLRSIPDQILVQLSPEMKLTQEWERGNQKLVREIIESYSPSNVQEGHPTIFHELLGSTLPAAEKSYERLWQEGSAMIGAGVETTSNTLNVIIFHLLQNPSQLARLKQELEEAIPNESNLPSWQELESLPYLGAVISEGLRKAYGTVSRLIRVEPQHDLHYKDYVLPAGTPVSMTIMLLNNNPDVFPNPERFLPERWLSGKLTRAALWNFGKGPRMCAGIKYNNPQLLLGRNMLTTIL